MNNTLKQLQEKGEISFKEMIYGSHGNGELINKDEFFFKIEDMLVFLHQQTTMAYNAGKADMLDTVLKEIDNFKDSYEPNLSYQDPLFRDAQTAGENSLIELLDTLKNKLLVKSK